MLRPRQRGGRALGEGVKLTDEQRLDWLRLIRSDNIGPRGIMYQMHQPTFCGARFSDD
jgi:hypothetical protein